MKKTAFLLCVLFFFMFLAYSEETVKADFEPVEKALSQSGMSVGLKEIFSSLLTGEADFSPESVICMLTETVRSRIGAASAFLTKSAFFMCLAAFLKQLVPQGKNTKAWMMMIHLLIALTMYREMQQFFITAQAAMNRISGVIDAVTPILVSVIAFTGDTHTSSFITPFGAFLSGALSAWLQKGALMLLTTQTCLHLANAAGDMPLGKLIKMIKSVYKWLIGTVMSVFLLTMSAGGAIAGAYDGAVVKGLKYAADSLIPIVGGDIAAKMESIASSAQLLKSAAGITGVIALISACLLPAIDVFLAMWGLRAISAFVECVSDAESTQLSDSFSDVFSDLFSLIAASLIMGIVYIGTAVGIGKRVFN